MGNDTSHAADCPDRARLIVLAAIAMGLLLGGSRAQCSLMTGDDEEDDVEDDDDVNP